MSLSLAPSTVAAQVLKDLGFVDVFAQNEPAAPDVCATVYDTSPSANGRLMLTGEVQLSFGLQVRVRAVDPEEGRSRAEAICEAMNEIVYDTAALIDGKHFVVHSFTSAMVTALGREVPASNRYLWTINTTVSLKEM